MEPQDMMAAVTDSMAERTGRTLDDWVDAVQTSGVDPLDQKAVRRWLKDVHGVPQNSQWAIAFAAAEAAGWERPSTQGYADQLYSGAKASLRPLHDAVVELALAQGDDAEAQGRGTYIPVVRKSPVRAGRCASASGTAARCPTTHGSNRPRASPRPRTGSSCPATPSPTPSSGSSRCWPRPTGRTADHLTHPVADV